MRAPARRLRRIAASAAAAALLVAGAAAQPAAAVEPGPGQWYADSLDLPEAWKTSTGKGVKVAVVDSGVDDGHENLKDRVVGAKDFSGAKKDGTTPVGPEATIHHGTAVAGVIAGTGADVGPVGVAPDAKILSASIWLGPDTPDGSDSRDQAAEAVKWAADSGAKVINMSLGWSDPAWPESWDDAFLYAYKKDALVIACVGNASQGAERVWSPATVPGVIGVGGVGKDGRVDSQSTAPGTDVDLMAPSQNIPVPFTGGGYGQAEGCSFAAPIVAGVAALIRAEHPDYSADQTAQALRQTAAPVKDHDGTTKGDHFDTTVGYGRIQPVEALKADVTGDVPSAEKQLAAWVRMHRRADDQQKKQEKTSSASAEETQASGKLAVDERRGAHTGPAVFAVLVVGAVGAAGMGIVAGRRDRSRKHTGV